jgi:hypothetical protein
MPAHIFAVPLVSPSLDERIIENKEGDAMKIEMAEALRVVRIAAENARAAAIAIHGDTTRTPSAQHVEANEYAFKVTKPALGLVDRTLGRVDAELLT